jgi:hypothetical protein
MFNIVFLCTKRHQYIKYRIGQVLIVGVKKSVADRKIEKRPDDDHTDRNM